MSLNNENFKTTLLQIIQKALEKSAKNTSVALPATVINYKINGNKVCADLQIMIKYEDNSQYVDFPRVNNVPVQIISGSSGRAFLSMPIKPGDTGLVIACDLGIDNWKGSDGQSASEPSSLIMHSFSHAIFFPGIGTNITEYPGINTTDIKLVNEDGSIVIKSTDDFSIQNIDCSLTMDNDTIKITNTSGGVELLATNGDIIVKPSTSGKYIKIGSYPQENPVIANELNILLSAIFTTINAVIPGVSAAWAAGYPNIICKKIKIPPYTE